MKWFAVRYPSGFVSNLEIELHFRFRAIDAAMLIHGFAVVSESTLRRLLALPGGDLLDVEEMPEGIMNRGVYWLRIHGD